MGVPLDIFIGIMAGEIVGVLIGWVRACAQKRVTRKSKDRTRQMKKPRGKCAKVSVQRGGNRRGRAEDKKEGKTVKKLGRRR